MLKTQITLFSNLACVMQEIKSTCMNKTHVLPFAYMYVHVHVHTHNIIFRLVEVSRQLSLLFSCPFLFFRHYFKYFKLSRKNDQTQIKHDYECYNEI